jgi:hypothetical protein
MKLFKPSNSCCLNCFSLQRALNGANYHGRDVRQDALNEPPSQNLESDGWSNKEDVAYLPGPSTTRDELKDAEVGLFRAKEEYRRLQTEVRRTPDIGIQRSQD